MLIALPVPAIVEINPPGGMIWPTSSGKVYTSAGDSDFSLVIKFKLPADPAKVTKFTLIVAALALKLVAVNLSMIVVTLLAVYCVVCVASTILAGTKFFAVTVIRQSFYMTTQREPEATVTTTPLEIVIGPADKPAVPLAIV